jgi:DNA-binding NtrC family response regulator
VNCGAIPEGIIESELFGHKKGAYTDAREDRKGYFETANKGTIFLDEIGETPLETQVKLLRVLESGEFMPVGASKTKRTDVRVVAATNKDLAELVEKGQFRQDLYYRLKTVTINVPALRHRVEDISLLVERFALEFTRSNDMVYRGFMPEAIRAMKNNPWNGNVRELKNFVESIIVLERGERITVEMVDKQLGNGTVNVSPNPALPMLMQQPPEAAERELILRQLFLLRQDVEFLKQLATPGSVVMDKMGMPMIPQNSSEITPTLHIDEETEFFIKNGSIGDMSIEDLEREAIERTLRFFNNNRRATAKSLGMSERTLYRKIDQFGLERKIKN